MKENTENKMKGILQAYKKPQETPQEDGAASASQTAETQTGSEQEAAAQGTAQDKADTAENAAAEKRAAILAEIEDAKLRAALIRKQCERRGRPKKTAEQRVDPDTYQRTTLILDKVLMDKFREISFRETLTLKELVNSALARAIEVYEAKNGKIVPKEHGANAADLFSL